MNDIPTKADFDARYTVRESGGGYGMWDRREQRFTGRHPLPLWRARSVLEFCRQHHAG